LLLNKDDDPFLNFEEILPGIPILKKYSERSDESIKEIFDELKNCDDSLGILEFEDFLLKSVGSEKIANILSDLYSS